MWTLRYLNNSVAFGFVFQVLTSLRMLLMMKPAVIHSLSRQLAYGLHDLLRTNAANIHCADDWYTLFTLLEVVGAGAMPPAVTESGTSITDNSSDTGQFNLHFVNIETVLVVMLKHMYKHSIS